MYLMVIISIKCLLFTDKVELDINTASALLLDMALA